MADDKKKVKQAIALEYNPEEDAPKVVASGRGVLAEKIIDCQQAAPLYIINNII